MMRSRGKPRPCDRSDRLIAALIPRDPNGYFEPKPVAGHEALDNNRLVLGSLRERVRPGVGEPRIDVEAQFRGRGGSG